MCMSKLSRITSYPFFLQHLKKEVSDEVDFVHADKHESLLQIDIMILIGIAMHSQSSQNSKFPISLQYLKQEVGD